MHELAQGLGRNLHRKHTDNVAVLDNGASGKRGGLTVAWHVACKVGEVDSRRRIDHGAAKHVGERARTVRSCLETGGEVDLLGNGVNDVAARIDQECIVVAEMLAEALGPSMKLLVVEGVIGVVAGVIELVLLAGRRGVLIDIELWQQFSRIRAVSRPGEIQLLHGLDDSRIFARRPDVGGHGGEIIFEGGLTQIMKQPQAVEGLRQSLRLLTPLDQGGNGKAGDYSHRQ